MASSIAGKALKPRQFRILALPLARLPRHSSPSPVSSPASANSPFPSDTQSPSPNPSTTVQNAVDAGDSVAQASRAKARTPLLLFHVQQPDPTPESLKHSSAAARRVKWALDKASDQWLKLGEKDKKSWMYWFYSKGEGLMDKIEYEEWALKAISENQGVRFSRDKDGKEIVEGKIEIPLLKPTLKDQPLPSLLPKLHRQLSHRIPYHRKMMKRAIILSPLTWPFAIIPILPNFPLFYVLWRAWSHYKAYRGATYLDSLLKHGMIVEKSSSAELDEVYASRGMSVAPEGEENRAPDSTSSKDLENEAKSVISPPASPASKPVGEDELPKQAKGEQGSIDGTATPKSMIYNASSESKAQTDRSSTSKPLPTTPIHPDVLLTLNQVPLISRMFDLRANEVIDINRAVEQAELRLRAADAKSAAATAEQGSGKQDGKSA